MARARLHRFSSLTRYPTLSWRRRSARTCPLIEPCLRGALARREPVGVWGGQLFADGVVIPRKRKRGRPPKVAAVLPSEPTLPASQAHRKRASARAPRTRAQDRLAAFCQDCRLRQAWSQSSIDRSRSGSAETSRRRHQGAVSPDPIFAAHSSSSTTGALTCSAWALSSVGRASPLQGEGRGIEARSAHVTANRPVPAHQSLFADKPGLWLTQFAGKYPNRWRTATRLRTARSSSTGGNQVVQPAPRIPWQ